MHDDKFPKLMRWTWHTCSDDKKPDQQDLIYLGLLAVAESDYKKGFKYFDEITKIDPSNIMVRINIKVLALYVIYIHVFKL